MQDRLGGVEVVPTGRNDRVGTVATPGRHELVGQQEAATVAVVPDPAGDAGDAGHQGGREGIGEQQGGVVHPRADAGGNELGPKDATTAFDVDLVEQVETLEEFVAARAAEAADEAASKRLAKQSQGRRGHHEIADPVGQDDQESEGLDGSGGGHASATVVAAELSRSGRIRRRDRRSGRGTCWRGFARPTPR